MPSKTEVTKIMKLLTPKKLKRITNPSKWKYNPQCKDSCPFTNLDSPSEEKCRSATLFVHYDIRDAWGDRNYGLYPAILGLVKLCIMLQVRKDYRDSVVALVCKLRQILADVMKESAHQILESLPKTETGDLTEEHYHLCDLAPSEIDKCISCLWDNRIGLKNYIKDLQLCPEEYLEDVALIALVIWYKLTVVVIEFLDETEQQYRTVIYDGTNFSKSKEFKPKYEIGVYVVSEAHFLVLIELHLSNINTPPITSTYRGQKKQNQ